MSNQNFYLCKIKCLSQPSNQAGGPCRDPTQTITVNFEDRIGLLDLGYPLATVWAKKLDYLRANNRPAYVGIDPDTNIITNVYAPEAAKVWKIKPDHEVVYVVFHTSEARHYLRRNHPDFQKMLCDLQTAINTGSTILITSTPHDFEIIDVRPLPLSFGIETPPAPLPAPGPDPPVTWERAVELFNMMAARSCTPCSAADPCIPFKYPPNGCWIRAHLMCYLMMDQGETPEKVWIHGSLDAATSNLPWCNVTWGWHVAPTLMVQQAGGPDVKMVIDPSLTELPVTVDAWKALQGDPGATLTYTSWENYFENSGTATREQANNDMEYYRIALNELCAEYGPSPYACPIDKTCFFIIDRSTVSNVEVDAMLSIGSPAVIEAAFFVVVNGFTPDELGITSGSLSGVPDIQPTLTFTPTVAQMTIEVMPVLGVVDPAHLNRRQRITWKYKISFTGSDGFVGETQVLNLSASISSVTANANLYLIKQPNPYEIDGETAWLSTDLRVFQIKAGESRFGQTINTDPNGFITNVINNLNAGTGGETFENISVDQETSKLELSQSVGGVRVYNFAVAKVRYRAISLSAQNVRVFFRLFPASSTSLEYNQATTYRRVDQGGAVKPLLGIINNEVVTIPCFAAARIDSALVSMTQQTDPANVQTIPPNPAGDEVVRYFGCWLDINQTQPQFPISPSPTDGPYPANRRTIQELIRAQHQCLVSEIAFDPAPIPVNASPAISDKLAQRNLAIVESANPGTIASHRIPHVFEIKPTWSYLWPGEPVDELMIDWGNIPVGSLATLCLPGINVNDILNLAMKIYRSQPFTRIDAHTLQLQAGGVTYLPIPQGQGANYVGMMTVDLPATVVKGQVYKIVVRQVTKGSQWCAPANLWRPTPVKWRSVLGAFQLTIPVRTKEEMLAAEQRLLSNLKWIQRTIPAGNRWYCVFGRYVGQIARRVDALGGCSQKVYASPTGEWWKYWQCQIQGLSADVRRLWDQLRNPGE